MARTLFRSPLDFASHSNPRLVSFQNISATVSTGLDPSSCHEERLFFLVRRLRRPRVFAVLASFLLECGSERVDSGIFLSGPEIHLHGGVFIPNPQFLSATADL